ncbi:MAG: T9SS type A sorting domain-containing protein [Rhodothermaceae bacterium]|nr:T9SS type A sorting domain-containing protein [Rhodothermaceae bacterium]
MVFFHFYWHRDRVRTVAFSPDGTQLASGSGDETIRLWNVAPGFLSRRIDGHTGLVLSVVFSPDGTQLASGAADHTVRLWDLATGQEVRRFEGHSGTVSSVVFSQDGAQLISGAFDGTIRLWDVATGKEIDQLDHKYTVLSIAISGNDRLIASAGEGGLRVWDATATVLETVPAPSSEIPATLTHFPNPAGAFTTIEYVLSKASQVRLSVHDLLGREVISVLDAAQATGSHSLQLATGKLSGGMYFLRLVTNDWHMTQPLIVH